MIEIRDTHAVFSLVFVFNNIKIGFGTSLQNVATTSA